MQVLQIVIVVFFSYFLYSNAKYDPILAKYYVNVVQSTYCISNYTNWNCITCDKSIIPEYIVEHKGIRAIQGYDTKTNTIFTAFRGSSNIQNWIDNIQISKISPYNDETISVEKGFYTAYTYIKLELFKNLDILCEKYSTNELIIAGHSLGGALATLTSYNIMCDYSKYNIVSIFTFGSPRVGNKYFVESFNHYNISSYRITHYHDVVPHLPEEFIGYLHVPNEIWYNEDNSYYNKCYDYNIQEDNKCSNTCSPLQCTSIQDHLYYLNVSLGNDQECFYTYSDK